MPALFRRALLRPAAFLRTVSSTTVRRVLDVGSGSIKCEVAEVDLASNAIVRIIFSKSSPVLFLHDMSPGVQSHMVISRNTQALGVQAIRSLLMESEHLGVQDTAAVATAAFRKAVNGEAVVEYLSHASGIAVDIVSAEKEARFGFECARTLSGRAIDELLVWDCGAGSFQLSSQSSSHVDVHGSGTIRAAASAITTGLTRAQLVEALLDMLQDQLKLLPPWLQNNRVEHSGHRVVAIGSLQSIFNQQRVLSGLSCFSQLDVERTLAEAAAVPEHLITDFERERGSMINHKVTTDNAPYVLPKLSLLLGVMRHAHISEVSFLPTNGICAALHTYDGLWSKSKQSTEGLRVSPPSSANIQPSMLTLNWHLEKSCNYKCSFCYAHFEDVESGLEKEDGMRMLRAVRDSGFFKVNFAGGEPLLNQHLGGYIKGAKLLGLKTSIITNASRMTAAWLENYGPYLDQIGISCDSLDEKVNKAIGRGFGSHVAVTERALRRVRALNEAQGLDIKVKLNTVVMRQNHSEDWSEFLLSNGVQRWKIFKVLKIEGENDEGFDDVAVTDDDFDAFVARHAHLEALGVVMAPENNEAMTESYVMLTPDGRFYQNTDGHYTYSEPVLAVGVDQALRQTGFDYQKFVDRGGAYAL